MTRTLRCFCGATFAAPTGEQLFTDVERHLLVAHADALVASSELEGQVAEASLVAGGATRHSEGGTL
jgi:hypothetical protein